MSVHLPRLVTFTGWLAAILALAWVAGARAVDGEIRGPIPRGKVETFRIPSPHPPGSRQVWVYTPPGYEARHDTAARLLVAFDGGEYLEDIPVPRILDSLIAAGRVPPTIALLIADSTSSARLDDLANRAWFADYLAADVVPWVRAHWRVPRDPHRVIVTGSSAGGLASAYVALRHPEVFGNVLSQSGAFWRGNEASNDAPWQWVTSQVASGPRRDVRFWMEVGSTETHGALGGAAPSILEANRALVRALRAKSYPVTYVELPGGVHAPQTWGPRIAVGIVGLAGAP